MVERHYDRATAGGSAAGVWKQKKGGWCDKTLYLEIAGVLLVFLIFLTWSVAFAEEAAHGEEGGGFVKEWLWKIVNFGILAGILVYFMKKPLMSYLKSRTEAIQKSLNDAREAREIAEKALKDVEERLRLKDKEIEEIIAGARTSGEAESQALVREARKMSERILAQAKTNIDYEMKKAKDAIKEEAVELAMELAEQRLKEKLTPGEQKKLIEESITRLERQS